MRFAQQVKIALVAAGALLASGCWVSFMDGGYYAPRAGVVYVQTAPPARRSVVIPPRPVASAIWIGGYWSWTNSRYSWVDGYWNRNPPPRKKWQPGRWSHASRGWYWTPGRWR